MRIKDKEIVVYKLVFTATFTVNIMSSASRRSRLEALKAGQSSSDEEEEEVVYDEPEDEYEDLDDFVIEDKGKCPPFKYSLHDSNWLTHSHDASYCHSDAGYKASAHQRQSAASNRNRNTRNSLRGKQRQRGCQQTGSYAINRKRRNASNRTAAKSQSQTKQSKQSSMSSYFKKSNTRNVSRKYNSKRTATSQPKKSTKSKVRCPEY